MNLNLNKEEARLVSDAIAYFFTRSKVPNLLLDMYPGADVKDILSQLNYIIELGDCSEFNTIKIFLRCM